MVGIGAALSTTIGGVLIQHLGYRASFLGLAGIALLAFAVLWFAIPETLCDAAANTTGSPEIKPTPHGALSSVRTKAGETGK
jgi:predicted MFS family arabinose efflux permease